MKIKSLGWHRDKLHALVSFLRPHKAAGEEDEDIDSDSDGSSSISFHTPMKASKLSWYCNKARAALHLPTPYTLDDRREYRVWEAPFYMARAPDATWDWYQGDDELQNALTADMREYFEERTGLKGYDFEKVFLKIRDAAWRISRDPMFGSYWFVKPTLRRHPYYPQLLESLKGGATLVELDCRLGQNLRYLAHDGAPTHKMWAVDSHPEFWPLGRAIFGDMPPEDGDLRLRPANEHDFHATFLHANFDWSIEETRCGQLRGKADIILAVHVFNNLDEAILRLMLRSSVAPLSKPGTVFMGLHFGAEHSFVGPYGSSYFYDNTGFDDGRDFTFVAKRWLCDKDYGDLPWEILVYKFVPLNEWGFKAGELDWIRECDGAPAPRLYGAFFAFKRLE